MHKSAYFKKFVISATKYLINLSDIPKQSFAMKKYFFILMVLISASLGAQTITPLDSTIWSKDYNFALTNAKESGKPLVIVFSGSDWCKPCIMLREQVFVKPEFNSWAQEKVVCVCLDFPSQKKNRLPQNLQQQNDALAERFNPNGLFPLVVVINSDEAVLGNIGYKDLSAQDYVLELEKIINIK